MKPNRLVAMLTIVALAVCLSVGPVGVARAGVCQSIITCFVSSCTPVPTSLYTVTSSQCLEDGWYAGSTGCGVESCWVIFYCECGPPLTTGVCP
jgi:hypothetical protein